MLRPFATPLVPLVPILGVLSCAYLMLRLPQLTWIRFVTWLIIGLIIYFTYGRYHSRVTAEAESPAEGVAL